MLVGLGGAGLWPATTAFEPACLGFQRRAATTVSQAGGPLHAYLRNEYAQGVHRLLGNRCDPHFQVVYPEENLSQADEGIIRYIEYRPRGEVRKRLNRAVSKTVE